MRNVMHAHVTSAPFPSSPCMYTMTCPSEEAAAAMGSLGWADRWRTAEPAAPTNRRPTTDDRNQFDIPLLRPKRSPHSLSFSGPVVFAPTFTISHVISNVGQDE